MSRRIVSTNIRFNLEKEADRTAWEYLQHRDKKQYRSYSRAVITAVNDYFERRGRLASDPYLETREKEDAFLLRVLETIRAGFDHAAPVGPANTLLNLLQNISPQPASAENVVQEDQQESDDAALDFVDIF
ncbi:hypothetical protein D1159_18220 [Pseudoflavonifractor sp. 524-17]|uniref:hypothetical protein n=1 Tax=Pseudoflavonifractor sp. 524-17 TaxID=2304577 RepID=UPI001379EADC|nr:hypothetical protein [Pseudoflavonifractor sp. 524-17]NCE66445.1 hypothetical protein [Pseudoflavonifractor sp. 524-17]